MKLASQAYQKHKYVPLDTNKLHLLLFVRRNLKPIFIKKLVSKRKDREQLDYLITCLF
jgi:hypothetical protein